MATMLKSGKPCFRLQDLVYKAQSYQRGFEMTYERCLRLVKPDK